MQQSHPQSGDFSDASPILKSSKMGWREVKSTVVGPDLNASSNTSKCLSLLRDTVPLSCGEGPAPGKKHASGWGEVLSN